MHPYSPLHFYAATKYAVSALTEGVRQELRETNARIRVTVRSTDYTYILSASIIQVRNAANRFSNAQNIRWKFNLKLIKVNENTNVSTK
jgi:short-subunit dehydrogenase